MCGGHRGAGARRSRPLAECCEVAPCRAPPRERRAVVVHGDASEGRRGSAELWEVVRGYRTPGRMTGVDEAADDVAEVRSVGGTWWLGERGGGGWGKSAVGARLVRALGWCAGTYELEFCSKLR